MASTGGRTGKARKAPAIKDTTRTAKATRSTVSKGARNESTKGIRDQKARRTKTKLKTNVKAHKPSGVTKASKNLKTAAKVAKGANLAGGLLSLGMAAASESKKVKKAVASNPKRRGAKGQMKRKK